MEQAFNEKKDVANCGGGGMSMAVHQDLRWRCARGKDLVHNVQWVCTVQCTLHVMELEHTITRYSATFQTCQEKVNWYLNLRLSNERPLQKAPTLSSLFKMSFFSLLKKNVWDRFSPGVVGVQETQEKNCYGHLAEVGLTNTRAEKICRLYCVKHDNAL